MKHFLSSKILRWRPLLGVGLIALSLITVACSSTTSVTTTPGTTTATTTVSSMTTSTLANTITTATTATTTPTTSTTTTPPKPANPELILSSTTSTHDSGLMDVLVPLFEKETGYDLKPIYNGSGAAMALGAQGNADVLLVHSPAAEVTFMAQGNGGERLLVMHNDFIIVGPPSDPAGIKGMTSAVAALAKIAAAKATFYSRGDNSGTDVAEKTLFKQAGVKVADGSSSNPSWYIEGGAGTGMGALLSIASEKNGYCITDRSTYLATQSTLSLSIMVQGDPGLLNVYHVITVNPQKFPQVNAAGAKAFADFMVSPDTQAVIAQYGISQYGQPLFFADAGKPEIALTVIKGSTTNTYTMTQLQSLPSTTGWGSTYSSGTTTPSVQYVGVSLSSLIQAVGGMTATQSLKFTCANGTVATYTYAQVYQGAFNVWTGGSPDKSINQPLPIVAYSIGGNILDGVSGPLEIAIMTAQIQASDPTAWVKTVNKIEIIGQ
jgi:tungstate transport system substrate-binding protein